MKKSFFSIICLLVTIASHATNTTAKNDSIIESNTIHTRYDFRTHRYRQRWETLIPTHTKIQFAGNMGLISAGIGWDHGKRGEWETDLLLGILPKYEGRRGYMTMTVKETYTPWSVRLSDHWALEPLSTGMYINTIFGEEFWRKQPKKYPKSYYGFQTKVHFNLFIGQRLTLRLHKAGESDSRALTLFYEVSTCDFFLISAITNRYMRPTDFLTLSFGMKIQML